MKEKRPTLCIVAGPNGSGKTIVFTKQLLLLNNYNYAPVFLSLREDERDGGFFMLLNME